MELTVFENTEFGKVRTVTRDNGVWFVAKDVCNCLDVGNSREALTRLDEDEKADVSLNDGSQNRIFSIINESGLYSLVLSSRKPEAKKFKKWVTSEVLPAIRKHVRLVLDLLSKLINPFSNQDILVCLVRLCDSLYAKVLHMEFLIFLK